MHAPDGRDYENRITYDEIVRPERLVYSHGGGEDVEPVTLQTTVTFEAHSGKTKLIMRMVFPSTAERDPVGEKYRALEGANQTLGRLAKHLEHLNDRRATKQLHNRLAQFPLGNAQKVKEWYDAAQSLSPVRRQVRAGVQILRESARR